MKKAMVLAGLVLFVSGCSVAPQAVNMVPDSRGFQFKPSGKTLQVKMVSGGEESDALIAGSKINDTNFYEALTLSLIRSGLFANVNTENLRDYSLTAAILNQDQPVMGLNMTVSMVVGYTLTRISDQTVVMKETIPSTYTAKMGDAFVGMTRVKKANEGAVRENISQFLQKLSKLEL
jgi:hypothetical protein